MTLLTEFKTERGTILPLLNLKGKPYLQVAHRIVWFREEHPTWNIKTTIVDVTEAHAIILAQIINDEGRELSNAHKRCLGKGDVFYIEKAETGAIGRALALIGYGTQFAGDDLDEADQLADSPIDPAKRGPRWNRAFQEVKELLDHPKIKSIKQEDLVDMMSSFGFGTWSTVLDASADDLEHLVVTLRKEVKDGHR